MKLILDHYVRSHQWEPPGHLMLFWSFVARAFQQNMDCYKYLVAPRAIEELREWNAQNAGPRRGWRPEGAPTTDEGLPVLLENKGLSIVVISVALWRLEKKTSKGCIECISIVYLVRVRYPNQALYMSVCIFASAQKNDPKKSFRLPKSRVKWIGHRWTLLVVKIIRLPWPNKVAWR